MGECHGFPYPSPSLFLLPLTHPLLGLILGRVRNGGRSGGLYRLCLSNRHGKDRVCHARNSHRALSRRGRDLLAAQVGWGVGGVHRTDGREAQCLGKSFLPPTPTHPPTHPPQPTFLPKQQDLLDAGIATHFIPSARLPELENALGNLAQSLTRPAQREEVDKILRAHGLEEKEQLEKTAACALRKHRLDIDAAFGPHIKSVEEIIAHLEKHAHQQGGKEEKEWAIKTLSLLRKASPTSLKVTWRALKEGGLLPLEKVGG